MVWDCAMLSINKVFKVMLGLLFIGELGKNYEIVIYLVLLKQNELCPFINSSIVLYIFNL